MADGLRVQIASGHPHAGEYGILASQELADKLGRNRRVDGTGRLVQLENCAHGNDCCYVFPGDFRTSCARR